MKIKNEKNEIADREEGASFWKSSHFSDGLINAQEAGT